MLDQLQTPLVPADRVVGLSPGQPGTIDLDSVLAAARRQWKVVGLTVVAAVLLAVGYIIAAVPIYTSAADILIDSRQFGAVEGARDHADLTFNQAAIDSQVEILKSSKIALSVIRKLKLTEDPEFSGSSFLADLIGSIVQRFQSDGDQGGDGVDDSQTLLERRTLVAFQKVIQVKRVEKTFVLNAEFSSRDSRKAALIANTIANTYLLDHLDAKYDATRRASVWLQERIEELRQKTNQADVAVAKFKEENKLIGARGSLVNEQQLGELNSQLTIARSETARAQAKYDLIQALLKSKRPDAAVAESLNNQVMTDLRNKYLKALKRATELTVRVGPNHESVVAARAEAQQYEQQLLDELSRIAETYMSDLQIARAREQSLTEGFSTLMGANAGDNLTTVTLREKEREAESYRVLYQAFLQRFQEATQQQTFPITEARVITEASRSSSPSKPRKLLVGAIGLAGGLCLGIGVGMLREYRDRGFRTSDQVRDAIGLEFLGIIPTITPADLDIRDPAEMLRVSVDCPLSKLSDTLRTVKVAIDLDTRAGPSRIIGVVSAVTGEGKSTISANLAMLLGNMGAATLLIDGDMRQSGLTKAMGIETGRSLADAVVGMYPMSAVAVRLADLNVWFLPCSKSAMTPNSSQILGSERMRDFLKLVSDRFKYIVIDLPPLGALVDAKAIAPFVNNFLLVVEWGKTARSVTKDALAHNEVVRENCVGAILNKADPGLLRLYDAYGADSYGYSRY